jgi:predicted permease
MAMLSWLIDLANDCRLAARSLAKSPAFTLTAILTIAIGIGANTAVFSVIHSVILDPLPFREPERLVHIASTHPAFPSHQVSAPDFSEWQRNTRSFEQSAAYTFQAMNKWTILGDGEPEVVQVVQASHNLFPMLGVSPLRGRVYTAGEDRSKAPVVLISETLWRRKYRADPSIVGRKILLVNWPVTVIGVIARQTAQPAWADVWMGLSFLDPALTGSRRFRTLEVLARLKPGVSTEQAQTEMTAIANTQARTFPDTNGQIGAAVLPLSSWMTGQVRPALFLAWAAVALVFLLACANVAHLVLVRSIHRSREIALRAALGAGFVRVARFLLTESLLIAAAGALAGVFAAGYSLPVLLRLAGSDFPRVDYVSVSLAAVLFSAAVAVVCSCLFSLPAILLSRRLEIHQVMKQGALTSKARSWFGGSIIAGEVALAFVVMSGAALLGRSYVSLLNEETGFDARGVLAADVPLALNWERSAQIFEQHVATSLRAIPGVTMVAAANIGPMILRQTEATRFTTRFGIAGRTFDQGQFPVAQIRWTTPGYFSVLRIPLKQGRLFTNADIGKPGCLINESLARQFFAGQDPVGRQILINVTGPKPEAAPIIGVVGDVRDLGMDTMPAPTLYSLAISNKMTVLLRTSVEPASLIPAVRSALRKTVPDSPITYLEPLEDTIRHSLVLRRFTLELLGVFALLAGLLTAIGVYGIISYSLSHRTLEFAIRFALGAPQTHVWRLLLRQFGIPAIAGLAAGVALAAVFTGSLRSQLYRLSPMDPAVLGACAAALLLLVLASSSRPAAKVRSNSPTSILRE